MSTGWRAIYAETRLLRLCLNMLNIAGLIPKAITPIYGKAENEKTWTINVNPRLYPSNLMFTDFCISYRFAGRIKKRLIYF